MSLQLAKKDSDFQQNVQACINPTKESCPSCNTMSESTRAVRNLPPFLIFARDHLNPGERPPELLDLQIIDHIITFILVFISFNITSKHFTALFRFKPKI